MSRRTDSIRARAMRGREAHTARTAPHPALSEPLHAHHPHPRTVAPDRTGDGAESPQRTRTRTHHRPGRACGSPHLREPMRPPCKHPLHPAEATEHTGGREPSPISRARAPHPRPHPPATRRHPCARPHTRLRGHARRAPCPRKGVRMRA